MTSLNDFLLSYPLPTRKKLGLTGPTKGSKPEGSGERKLAKSVEECHASRISDMFVEAPG